MKQKKLLAMALAAVTVFGTVGEAVVPVVTANAATTVTPSVSKEVIHKGDSVTLSLSTNTRASWEAYAADAELRAQVGTGVIDSRAMATGAWTFTPQYVGTYKMQATLADGSKTDWVNVQVVAVGEETGCLDLNLNLSINPTTGAVGSEMTFTASATGGSGNYAYAYAITPISENLQDEEDAYANSEYQTSAAYKWTPTLEGDYVMTYNVWDNTAKDYAWAEVEFSVGKETPAPTPTDIPGPTTTPDPSGKLKTDITAVTPTAPKSMTITWNAVDGADGYILYRSDAADGKYTNVRSVTGGDVTSAFNVVEIGVTYYYKVVPYTLENGKKVPGELSAPVSGKTTGWEGIVIPGKVKMVSAERYKTLVNLVKWEKTTGTVHGYVVYREDASGKKEIVKAIKSSEATSYKNTIKDESAVYTYYVKAYAEATVLDAKTGEYVTQRKYGEADATCDRKTASFLAGPPTITGATANGTQVDLTWTKVDGADGYRIWVSDKADGTFVSACKAVAGENVTTAKVNTSGAATSYYMIRAYKVVDGNIVFTSESALYTYAK